MRLLIATVALGLVTHFAIAKDEKDKKNEKKTIEAKLLGTWKMVKSDQGLPEDHTFQITYKKGGEMVFTRVPKDKDESSVESKGTYKTAEPDDQNKLGSIDWKVKDGEDERGEVSKIIKLTETELVFEDPDGVKESFERVPEGKKPKKED